MDEDVPDLSPAAIKRMQEVWERENVEHIGPSRVPSRPQVFFRKWEVWVHCGDPPRGLLDGKPCYYDCWLELVNGVIPPVTITSRCPHTPRGTTGSFIRP
jgi:hypothetical protein